MEATWSPLSRKPMDPETSLQCAKPVECPGRQMMAKKKWKEGEGIGRHSQGRASPVMVDLRQRCQGQGLVQRGEPEAARLSE